MEKSSAGRSESLTVCPNPSVDMFQWIDRIVPNEVNRIEKEERYAGGKGIHVALALSELGADAEVLGFFGGATGEWIKRECATKGVTCAGVDVKGWTRECITFWGSEAVRDTELLGSGPEIDTVQQENYYAIFKENATAYSLVCMSASWPSGSPGSSYLEMIELVHAAGNNVFLDSSGTLLEEALEKHPFAVHINRKEGKTFFGVDEPEQLAWRLAGHSDIAAVMAGADGLYLISENEGWHASCRVDNVISAVGSGDCLLAGLLYAYQNEPELEMMSPVGRGLGSGKLYQPGSWKDRPE